MTNFTDAAFEFDDQSDVYGYLSFESVRRAPDVLFQTEVPQIVDTVEVAVPSVDSHIAII